MNVYGPSPAMIATIYSDTPTYTNYVAEQRERDPANAGAQEYLEASFAAKVPAWPLSDPFLQAENYKDTLYLGIQHLMMCMQGVMPSLEKKTTGKKGSVAQSGAHQSDQGYEPFEDHPLSNILINPNPADSFADFVCQCIMNWNLHGRLLIWARPNNVGAPIRYYCLPVPLCVPAFQVGAPNYPLGAWRIQQFYPTTGIAGILPNGLVGSAGAIIDAREIYELKNPHPVYRWAPYSHLVGGQSAVDNIQNIDLSFWSIMAQGPKPAGFIDAPGADNKQITGIQNKIDNAAGGARKHGRPIVLGGGDPDRPALKWNPVGALVPDALHEGGWEIYTSFVLALLGLDMTSVGLRPGGGSHAERWAANKEKRKTLTGFLSRLSALLTTGGLVKQWGLLKKGVRVAINLPEDVGYDPAEMSRDGAGDGSLSTAEIRRLRGFKGYEGVMEEFNDLPLMLALEMAKKKLGIDDVAKEKTLGDMDAKRQEQQSAMEHKQGLEASSAEAKNNPDNNRPSTPEGAKGSLGGAGSGAPKQEIKAIVEEVLKELHPSPPTPAIILPPQEELGSIVQRILKAPVLLNGVH